MFEKVQFDGETPVGHFATWYWNASENSEERGTTLLNLERSGEEFRAMERLFFYSMKSDSQIGSIKRVQNNEMRLIYELQRRSLQKKVTAATFNVVEHKNHGAMGLPCARMRCPLR